MLTVVTMESLNFITLFVLLITNNTRLGGFLSLIPFHQHYNIPRRFCAPYRYDTDQASTGHYEKCTEEKKETHYPHPPASAMILSAKVLSISDDVPCDHSIKTYEWSNRYKYSSAFFRTATFEKEHTQNFREWKNHDDSEVNLNPGDLINTAWYSSFRMLCKCHDPCTKNEWYTELFAN